MPEPRYETRQVLADAYPVHVLYSDRPLLTHTVRITPEDLDGVPLCRRVKADHIADPCADPDGLQKPPTCPTCLRRDPRFRETGEFLGISFAQMNPEETAWLARAARVLDTGRVAGPLPPRFRSRIAAGKRLALALERRRIQRQEQRIVFVGMPMMDLVPPCFDFPRIVYRGPHAIP